MGQQEPMINVERQVGHLTVIDRKPVEMEVTIGHYGGYYITTKEVLKGQGIKLLRDHYESIKGYTVYVNEYKVTDRAYAKLKQQYDMKMECLLD
jgi:hypothetical protein